MPQSRSLSAMASAALDSSASDDGSATSAPGPQSLFVRVVEMLPYVKDEEGNILTDNFLDVCQQVLPVIGESFWLCALLQCADSDSVRNMEPNSEKRAKVQAGAPSLGALPQPMPPHVASIITAGCHRYSHTSTTPRRAAGETPPGSTDHQLSKWLAPP